MSQSNNKGKKYLINPLMAEDVAILLQNIAPNGIGRRYEISALRLRMLIVTMYRTGVRISEALDLMYGDILPNDHCFVVRKGKGNKRRVVAMDDWAWDELQNWLEIRKDISGEYLFPVIYGPTAGEPVKSCDIRRQLRYLQKKSGINKRIAPHQFRHGHAVELWREGIDMYTVKEQLGHCRLDTTAIYLKGIDPIKVLGPIGKRQPPMIVVN